MPIARFEMPDGRIARFEVPEGTTPEQAQAQIDQLVSQQSQQQQEQPQAVNDPLAGLPQETRQQIESRFAAPDDRRQATRTKTSREAGLNRAAEIERLRLDDPGLAELIEKQSPLDAFLIGAGRGLTTIGRGLGLAEDEGPAEAKAIEGLRGQQPSFGVGELAGETAPFLVGGPITGLARTAGTRALATGALGATEGGVITSGRGGNAKEIAMGAGLGFLFGSGAELALPAINRASRKVLGKNKIDQPFDDAGKLKPEAVQALDDAGIEIDDFLARVVDDADIGDQARREAFEKLGLTPTQAQATRDKNLFGEQVEAFTREGRVTEAIERQDRALQDLTRTELGAIGGNPERAQEAVSNAIIDKAVMLDDEVSGLYRAAREAAPDAKNVKFSKASETLRQNAPSNELSGGVISSLKGKMESMGVMGDNFKPSGKVSIDQAEELRKYANRLFSSTNEEGRFIIRQFKDSLDEDALRSAGDDFFKEARAAKSRFEKGLSTEGKSKFSRRKKSLVRDILEEKIPENKILDRIVTRGSSYDQKSLRELRDYLTTGNDAQVAQGVQAWNDIRSGAFRRIVDDAFKGPINREGVQSLSRAGLESAIKKIGPEKFNVLFSPAERDFLKDLSVVAALREAPPGVRPSPSGPAIRTLQRALSKIPWLGGELANEFIDSVKDKASEKRIMKLVDMAEEAAKKNNQMFESKIRRGRIGQLGAASTLTAIPAAAAQEDQE